MLISINITGDIKGLETEWLAFQARACGSFYQTWQWCSVWQEQVGARLQVALPGASICVLRDLL